MRRILSRFPAAMALLILSATAVLAAARLPTVPDEVDFSLVPPAELWFSRFRKLSTNLNGDVTMGQLGAQKQTLAFEHREWITEKIDKVENGRVVALKRKYEEAITSSSVETNRMLSPRKNLFEELYSTLDFSAEWKNGQMELRVIPPQEKQTEGDDRVKIDEPAEEVREALLHAFDYPGPLLPGGKLTSFGIGESWTLSDEAVNRLFPRRLAFPFQGTVTVTFFAVEPGHPVMTSTCEPKDGELQETAREKKPFPCAVLKSKARLKQSGPDRLSLALDFEGTHYFSLQHRIVVKANLAGTMRVSGKQNEYEFRYEGSYKETVTAEIHRLKK